MIYSTDEIIEKGQKLYDEMLRINLEPRFNGKILALDIETGTFALGEDTLSAFNSLNEKDPNATIYLLRVGHTTAITLGASSTG